VEPTPIDLSILIVSWNVRDLLAAALAALPAAAPATWEAIVIDNASQDGSAAMVAERFPDVALIRNAANAGFGRANNQGMALAKGRYVVFLNCDTIVPAAALTRLVGFMDAHPEAGACGPRLLLREGRPQAYAFGGDPRPGYLVRRGLNRLVRGRALHDWATSETQAVDWVSGACLLVRREALPQVGGFDEAFFMYFEDNDLCLRLRQAGWQVFYCPQVSITHLGGQSLKQNATAQRVYQDSLVYFYRKHYSRFAQGWLSAGLGLYRLLASPSGLSPSGRSLRPSGEPLRPPGDRQSGDGHAPSS